MRQRRRFTPAVKAQVVLEVLTGPMSPAEASRKHGLGPDRLSLGKTAFLQRAHAVFQADDHRSEDQARIAELERRVGQLTRERAT
jgi:transposase-like protein